LLVYRVNIRASLVGIVVTSGLIALISTLSITAGQRHTLTGCSQLLSIATLLITHTVTGALVYSVGQSALSGTHTATLLIVKHKPSSTVGVLVTHTATLIGVPDLISRACLSLRTLALTAIMAEIFRGSTALHPGTLTLTGITVEFLQFRTGVLMETHT